jgi:hypothetical protein
LLEDLVDREMPLEDEIAAVFDLVEGVLPLQVDGLAVLWRKLGTQEPGPIVQPFFDDGGAQLIGGRLSCLRVRCR